MITNYIATEFKPLYTPFDYYFPPCKEYIPLLEIEPAPRKASHIYREIVFLQESDAEEFITMLNNDGEAAVIKCLVDYFDYGDGERHTTKPWSSNDRVFRADDYILAVNFYIPYVALHSVE